MRYLYLLRHASTEGAAADGDAARRLTARGEAEAHGVGERLARLSPLPSTALCSNATRVQQTLAALQRGAGAVLDGLQVRTEAALYLASADQLLAQAATLPPASNAGLMIAHNPGLSDLGQSLVGSASDEALPGLGRGFRPATLMVLRFDASRWEDLRASSGHLLHCLHAG